MEEFKLPEKWCIKVTNCNIEILSKYRLSIYGSEIHEARGYIYNYYSGHGWNFEKPISYIEITSSFFKKYVLEKEEDKQEPEKLMHPEWNYADSFDLNYSSLDAKEPGKAMRHNEGKPKWSYVHFKSFLPMVRVLEKGAIKYAPKDWKKGMPREEILESMMRHLAALMDGEFIDQDLQLHHIGNIMCNAMFYSYHFHDKEMNS